MTNAYGRLQSHVCAHRHLLAERYKDALLQTGNPLGELPLDETERAIAPILDHIAGERTSIQQTAPRIGQARARQLRNPMHSLRAASTLYTVAAGVIREGAEVLASPRVEELRLLATLHNAIIQQVSAAALPYSNVLLRQIHSAQREERKRIARDLHDRASYAIAIALQQIELRQIAIENGNDGEAYLEVLGHSLREAATMIQEIALELGQSDTSDGLIEALETFIANHGQSRVTLQASGRENLHAPEWILEEAYLAIREGVRNALRHSRSPQVQVIVNAEPGEMRAQVIDTGAGFSPDSTLDRGSGKGMVSMFERVQLLGGDFDVTSSSQGTTLTFAIPLPTG